MINIIFPAILMSITTILPLSACAEPKIPCGVEQLREIKKYIDIKIETDQSTNINFLKYVKKILPSKCNSIILRNSLLSEGYNLYPGHRSNRLLASKDIKYYIIGHKELRMVFIESNDGMEIDSANVLTHTL